MDEKFEIEIDGSAFDAQSQSSNLQGRRQYTRGVAEMQNTVEALDRYDDFGELKIGADKYEKAARSVYGIPKSVDHAGGDVIFEHQKSAALQFLRDLRGFGLLADVVGSGKTFEAGVILSELAVRNKVKSLLVVAPNQVFDNWVEVLEERFGLGKGVLYQVRNNENEDGKAKNPTFAQVLGEVGTTRDGRFFRPNRPIIVDVEVFAEWKNSEGLLIDVIVVDEAHHLCEENGRYPYAMKLLSEMMKVKKEAEATYCLLLTATPHSGNLANMFRLWYFIRCRGGNPEDFVQEKEESRSAEYKAENKFYYENICHGSSNITEFIRKVTHEEVTNKHYKELAAYLGVDGMKDFSLKSEYEQSMKITEFLEDRKNLELRTKVMHSVAGAYHNGVLRSIMIRQANHLSKEKNVKNVFFFPVPSAVKSVEITGLNEEPLTVDFLKTDADFMPYVNADGEKSTLCEYIKRNKRNGMEFGYAYSEIFNAILGVLSKKEGVDKIFTKKGYAKYYSDRVLGMTENVAKNTALVPVKHSAQKLGYKYEYAKKILSAHKGRVLVFFDYELGKNETVYDEFIEALSAEEKFKSRIIIGNSSGKNRIVEEFNKKDDAILVVKDAGFTEGANLQACNVIINYQVTPDPLAMDQRIGRIFRLGQKNDVEIYSLADMHRLEGFALAYFASIGLLSSNSGDATILAGSNSDNMVAIRCRECRKVKLLPRQEYELELEKYKKTGSRGSVLVCDDKPQCRLNSPDGKGTLMSEISVYDFKCDNCGIVLSRSVSDEGYLCVSRNDGGEKGKMCNSGEYGDRAIYCRKICSLSNCGWFKNNKTLANGCTALKAYRENKNISDAELGMFCATCRIKECHDECKIKDVGPDEISACSTCRYSECSPKPYVLDFDDKWSAECPACRARKRRGLLKPIVARTFATFIRESWKFAHDGGESFCENLGREADNVHFVRDILGDDGEARR